MEFLVRLEDKVNIQVICLNPAHKERVIYDDPTFIAPCPECGSDGYLYRKNNAVSKKGAFITYKPDGWSWGKNERKHYGIIRIVCTEEQAQEWCATIENEAAKADVVKYQGEAETRFYEVYNNLPNPKTKVTLLAALDKDVIYKAARYSETQAENRAQIDHRHRKSHFDFESDLSEVALANWNDKRSYSVIVEQETVTMGAI